MGIDFISDGLSTIKKGMGGKGIWILAGGGLIFVFYSMIKNQKEEVQLVTPTGYTSYPDAVTNANTIIDSVNKNSNYNKDSILDSLGDLGNYIGDVNDGIMGGFDDINNSIKDQNDMIKDNFDGTNGYIQDGFDNLNDRLDNDFSGINDGLGGLGDRLDDIKDQINSNPNDTPTTNPPSKPTPPPENKPADTTQYYSAFKYGGRWDANSIVDGFKSIGIFSLAGSAIDSVKSRIALAKANGIDNYTGTQAQNDKLVALGKQGKLKKA